MKSPLLFAICLLLLTPFPLSGQSFFDSTHELLEDHVENGLVNYQSLFSKKDRLNALTREIAAFDFAGSKPATQKAFLINAYNILVLQAIADAWPIASPQDVSGFFDAKKFIVAGRKVSLNSLEREWLLKDFFDQLNAIGSIPISLGKWEMTGNADILKILNQ